MAVVIRVDTREPTLLRLLNETCSRCAEIHNGRISVLSEPLDIGDVHICFGDGNGDGDGNKGERIIIERKTLADLTASIKDGRYKEQKVRLLASGSPPQHIIYILEDVPYQEALLMNNFPINGVRPSAISGMIIYTMLRDGIHVVNVAHTRETVAWTWSIALKCLSNPEKVMTRMGGGGSGSGGGGGGENNDMETGMDDKSGDTNVIGENHYLRHVKVKKMDNITPANCYVLQLCQIPGISVTTAGEIVAKYPTMMGLLSVLSSVEDQAGKIKMLSEIPMIGRKKAQLLLSYLLP